MVSRRLLAAIGPCVAARSARGDRTNTNTNTNINTNTNTSLLVNASWRFGYYWAQKEVIIELRAVFKPIGG